MPKRKIKGETFNNKVTPPIPENVRDYERPDFKPEKNMSLIKKFAVKSLLPFLLKGLDVKIEIDKDEAINVMSYKVDVTLYGAVIFSKEGAEVF